MKGHVEMIRTNPDEIFEIPDNGRLAHIDHNEQGLYVYFFVPHEASPKPAKTKGTGWNS